MQTSLLWRFCSDSASHGHVWGYLLTVFVSQVGLCIIFINELKKLVTASYRALV